MGKASYFNINSRTAFSISSSQWALQSQYHFTDEESDVFSNKIIYPKPSQPAAQQGRNVIQTSSRLVSDPVGRFKWKIFYYLFLQNLLPLPPFHTFFFFFFLSLIDTVFLSGIFKVCSCISWAGMQWMKSAFLSSNLTPSPRTLFLDLTLSPQFPTYPEPSK